MNEESSKPLKNAKICTMPIPIASNFDVCASTSHCLLRIIRDNALKDKCKLTIIGSNVAALAMIKYAKVNAPSTNINLIYCDYSNEKSENEHDHLFLLKFIRQFNEEAYDTDLMKYYGFRNEATLNSWQKISDDFKQSLDSNRKSIAALLENIPKSNASTDLNQDLISQNYGHYTLFGISKPKTIATNDEKSSKIYDILSPRKKSVFSIFDAESIRNMQILLYGLNSSIFEYAMFIASFNVKRIAIIIPKQISQRFNVNLLGFYRDYLNKNQIQVYLEEDIVKLDEDAFDALIRDFDQIFEMPTFQSVMPFDYVKSANIDQKDTQIKLCCTDLHQQEFIGKKIASIIIDDSNANDASKIDENLESFTKSRRLSRFSINTPFELVSLGMSNEEIEELKKQKSLSHEVANYAGSILEHNLSFGELQLSSMLVTYISDTKEIIRIEIMSPHADSMLRGFDRMLEYNLNFTDLPSNIGIHPTFMENIFKNLNIGDALDTAVGCAT